MSTLTPQKKNFKKIIIRVSQKFCPQTYDPNFLKSIPLNFDQKISDASSNTLVYWVKVSRRCFSIFRVKIGFKKFLRHPNFQKFCR